VDMLGLGEIGQLGANLGKVGFKGVESGITDPFLSRVLQGVGAPQVASTGDTCLLEFGDQTTCGVRLGNGKSGFIQGLGMKGLGWWMEGWGFGCGI